MNVLKHIGMILLMVVAFFVFWVLTDVFCTMGFTTNSYECGYALELFN
jgi:uncharacterized protein HemY